MALAYAASPSAAWQATAITPQRATGRLVGVAITGGVTTPGQPVRDAIVTISTSGQPGTPTQTTDERGQFVFADLPAGRYTLSATHTSHITTEFGAFRPGEAGTPVVVTSGQEVTGLIVTLPRGAVIVGVVRTAQGGPAPDVPVTARGGSAPRKKTALSDSYGAYRISGLPAGDYLVSATPIANTFDAPAPVFFPGTPDPVSAVTVSVAGGEERDHVDFSLAPPGTARVRGTVVDAAGLPTRGANVSIATGLDTIRQAISDAKGEFVVAGLPAGRYTLAVRHGTPPSRLPRELVQGLLDSRPTHWAQESIQVPASGLLDVRVTLRPSMTLSGHLAVEASASESSRASATTITLNRLDGAALPLKAQSTSEMFEVTGIVPGSYRLSANVAGNEACWLKSAELHGRSLLEGPLEFDERTGNLTDAALTLSCRRSELSGTIYGPDDRPAAAYWVAVFPADRRLLHPGSPQISRTRPGTDGQFTFQRLPIGEYLLAVFGDNGSQDWQRVAFVEQLATAGVKVVVREGARSVQDLRVSR